MKAVLDKSVVSFCLMLLCAGVALAAPTLGPVPGDNFPNEVQPGHAYTFNLLYKESKGDPPKDLSMILDTPGGQVTVRARPPSGDPTQGVPVTWVYTPENAGTYKFHFEATSSVGDSARYPASVTEDPQFISTSLVTKYLILVVGLAVALVFLPFVVYVGTRSANKRGNPAAAARIALMIGILAAFALFLYLFFTVYSLLVMAIVGIAALGLLIVLFTRR